WAFHHRSVSNGPISIIFSGALLAMIVFGGTRALLGPALGALIFVLIRDGVGIWAASWLVLPALMFFGCVIVLPDGLAGIIARWFAPPPGAEEQPVAPETSLPAALATPDRKAGAVLIARELAKTFGNSCGAGRAVAGIDIMLEPGALLALVGVNGAGKSTVLDLLSGVHAPDAGFVTVAGHALAGRGPQAFARAGVGRSFQIPALFGDLTTAENIRLAVEAGRSRRFAWWQSAAERAAVAAETAALLRYFSLARLAAVRAASLAPAEQRRLDIALALAAAPRVLLLDEPFAGLGDAERIRLAALVKDIARHIPVLLTAHEREHVTAIADAVTVMRAGRMQDAKADARDAAPAVPPSA